MDVEIRRSLLGHFTPRDVWQPGKAPVFVRGEGCFVYDSDGNRYFDGVSGLFCSQLGHGRTDIAGAAAAQMSKLAYMPNWSAASDAALEASALIAERLPGELGSVFFVNSGSEANEAAMKFAIQLHRSRGQPQRKKFITRDHAYHGTTLGALSLTALPAYRAGYGDLLLPGVFNVPNTFRDRDRSGAALPSLDETVRLIEREGPDTIAAIFAEPVQNGGGALVPDPTYWPELRAICDRYGILLVADEVITGFGRLGTWFGSHHVGAQPDMMTFAKGVTSAYFPAGGMAVKPAHLDEICDVQGLYQHGSTWGAHPVAMAVVVANIRAMENEAVLANVRALEPHWAGLLNDLASRHPIVREVRGAGLMHAMELTRDRDNGATLTENQINLLVRERIPAAFRATGALFKADNRGGAMIVLCPPLNVDAATLTAQAGNLDRILTLVSDDIAKLD
ncbi:MAG: aminotransferase class III-fold pyridoxal phosphate-dependent enzyme [Rhodobacteraceae bacterium]|jgi:adenosylmethionine-8-amino-7-oxononanoate aminotransferase|nr:aminotransferase class III-fold pyridoxal phosphate-dependent enzyme [Paracoccaceae bacterium]